jgi:transcription antitermination factor NusG
LLLVAGEDAAAGVVKVEVDEEATAVASGDVVAVDSVAVAGEEAVKVEVEADTTGAKVEVEVDTTPTTRELPTLEEYIGVFCDV